MSKYVSPTIRGQITIPTEVRKKLQITPKTKLKVYIDGNKVILEPVATIDLLLQDLESEARTKGYTRDELEKEIDAVREKLMKELY
jgi:antitoxin PrlF